MDLELWDELRGMERRADDLFRAFLGPRARVWFPQMSNAWRRPFIPSTDVFARKGDLVIRIELAGIDAAKDVHLAVQDGELVVSGERKQKEEVKEEHYYRMEACYGAFERHIPVPEGTETAKIQALYKDGVLEIVVPAVAKALSPKAKVIPVKTAA